MEPELLAVISLIVSFFALAISAGRLREIGLLNLKGRPPLLRRLDEATLLTDTHRMALASKPATLADGGSRSASIDLDSAIDEFHGHEGSEYAYVLASGTIYLKKTRVLKQPCPTIHRS